MRPIGHRLFTGRGADIRELDHKLIERLLAASRLGSFLVTRRVFLSRCVVINPQATRMSFTVIVIGAIQLLLNIRNSDTRDTLLGIRHAAIGIGIVFRNEYHHGRLGNRSHVALPGNEHKRCKGIVIGMLGGIFDEGHAPGRFARPVNAIRIDRVTLVDQVLDYMQASLDIARRYEKAIWVASPAAQLLSAGSGCHNGL